MSEQPKVFALNAEEWRACVQRNAELLHNFASNVSQPDKEQSEMMVHHLERLKYMILGWAAADPLFKKTATNGAAHLNGTRAGAATGGPSAESEEVEDEAVQPIAPARKGGWPKGKKREKITKRQRREAPKEI